MRLEAYPEGKWADFAILDQRLNDPVGKELKNTLVSNTFFAGKRFTQRIEIIISIAKRFIAGTDINDSQLFFKSILIVNMQSSPIWSERMPNQYKQLIQHVRLFRFIE